MVAAQRPAISVTFGVTPACGWRLLQVASRARKTEPRIKDEKTNHRAVSILLALVREGASRPTGDSD